MSTTPTEITTLAKRPKRADARRNYQALIDAARATFAESGTSASLEQVARNANVGIGTLYRHFPSRQELLEAVYVDEVEGIARSAADFADLEPWEALSGWLRRFVAFAATKRALADELFAYIDSDAEVFRSCGGAITEAGEPLLKRAQDAGVVRRDVEFVEIVRMTSGIAAIRNTDLEQRQRILELALDGLRYSTD